MKKLTILLAALLFTGAAFAQKIQEREVPNAVSTSFKKQFPNTKNVVWEKEKSNYEAGFKMEGKSIAVVFEASGKVVETEYAIPLSALPPTVSTYLSKQFPGKKIKEAAKIIDAKGTTTYEAEIDGKDFIFDNSGKFLKVIKD